ncbi:hypothetical protein AKJ45_00160 [candidate division MSBL1 archaeon SCGC-AAA261F19]|uniref:Uncharacterized protein n=1 Tax=candidate division MSBL1 archaeon SCGC-AAA261F19 TaxID=1698275 RepID=A0A133VBT5_9EURY|nr:hypothetical protein AKJ45_00160 [candidate division MSBL1 archaeon SCGC-AAA261F19]
MKAEILGEKIKISADSECKMVEDLCNELNDLEISSCLAKFSENIVYQKASEILKHAACPIPCAIIKAVEVEADAAAESDVSITFIK